MGLKRDKLIRERAGHKCEYCRFPEGFAEVPFQIDHVLARQHGGLGEAGNLALVCCFCNRYKGPNLSGVDPITGKVVRLFNPRRQAWPAHFQWHGAVLAGKTAIGRATVQTLCINRPDAVLLRELLIVEGVFPP